MVADWYTGARRDVLDCLSSVLSIDDAANNHDGPTIDGVLLPAMTVDERARLAYFAASDRLQFAQRVRKLALSADWDQIVRDAETAAQNAHKSARAAYDERMAALTNSTEGN